MCIYLGYGILYEYCTGGDMVEKKKGDWKSFYLIFHYLSHKKWSLVLYLICVTVRMIPDAVAPFVWGVLLEILIQKNFDLFFIGLIGYETMYLFSNAILPNIEMKLYSTLEVEFMKKATKDLYRKIDQLPAIAFEKMGVGEFVNRLVQDPSQVLQLLRKLIMLFLRSIIAIVVIVVSFSMSFILGIEILVFAGITALLSYKIFPKIKNLQKDVKKESDQIVKKATENLSGIREIRALGVVKSIENKLFEHVDTMYVHLKKSSDYEANYYGLSNAFFFILEFVIFATCGYYFVQGKIAYSIFIMMETYIWRISYVMESLSDFGVNFNKVVVSLARMNEILTNKLYPDMKYGKKVIDHPIGNITFDSVEFQYSKEEEKTLRGLNMEITPHKKIAIVGRSGNGKSTIFNLLLRYFDATKGTILIDDTPIEELSELSLRKNISIIRQSPFLFNMSILDNLKLVNENVTLETVRQVCKKAYIDDYIMSLPKQYDTIIGEGGINLSGGQKQRIAIARTLLQNTKIILFDEATSALDNESQEYIKRTIDGLVQDHTIVIVAHRLSTIIDADLIFVIHEGRVEAKGTHKELLETCERYQSLYQMESM